jgi:hypothetical protein
MEVYDIKYHLIPDFLPSRNSLIEESEMLVKVLSKSSDYFSSIAFNFLGQSSLIFFLSASHSATLRNSISSYSYMCIDFFNIKKCKKLKKCKKASRLTVCIDVAPRKQRRKLSVQNHPHRSDQARKNLGRRFFS